MNNQGIKAGVRGGGSPTNPDSTCHTEEMSLQKLELRIQAMEDRLLQDQEEKFKQLFSSLKNLPGSGLQDTASDNLTNSQETLEKQMNSLADKIDHLLSGENETNKYLDIMIPNLKRVDSLFNLVQEKEKNAESFRKFLEDQMKDLVEENRTLKKLVKEVEKDTCYIRKDMDHIQHNLKEIRDIENKSRELVKSNNRKLDEIDRHTRPKRRRSAGSDSSGSRSSSESRSRKKRSRSLKRGMSKDTSITTIRPKTNDMEKLLVQIHDSIGVLSDKLDKKITGIRDILDQGGSLLTLPSVDKWDEDASPSPLRKPPGTPSTLSEVVSITKSAEKSSKKNKKKRKRSSSSSSSSSEEEEVVDQRNLKKNIANIGTKVNQLDMRLKEMTKAWKKNAKSMEDNSRTVLQRVGEMTSGVHIIAENVDSMLDVGKRLETIDDIKDLLEYLESVPKRLKSADEKNEKMMDHILHSTTDIKSRLNELASGSNGRNIMTDEYTEISSMLVKLEEENSKKFCEFGGLVESLEESIARRLDRGAMGGGGGGDTSKGGSFPPDERLMECLRNVEKTQKNMILPALTELIHLSQGSLPPTRDGASPGGSERASDTRLVAVTHQLSQLQPRLDDLYTRVLPSLENLTSRVRKVEERERLAEKEDNDHIQRILDIVEDLKEERTSKGLKSEVELDRPDLGLGVKTVLDSQGEKLDEIFKAIYEFRNAMTSLQAESAGSLKSDFTEMSGGLGKLMKKVDTLLTNSNSDAKTISGLNTSLQSMKASVNGVNSTVKDLKELHASMDQKLLNLGETTIAGETKLQTEIISNFGSLRDEMKSALEKTGNKQPDTPGKNVQLGKVVESLDKLVSKVTLLEVKLNIDTNTRAKGNKAEAKVASESMEKVSEDLENLGKEIKSQLDDVHDMVASMEEKTIGLITEMRNDLNVHDKHTGISVNKIALVMRDLLDQSKQISGTIPAMETKIISASKESSEAGVDDVVARLEERLRVDRSLEREDGVLDKMKEINSKYDKTFKMILRIKQLLEAEETERPGARKKSTKGTAAEEGAVTPANLSTLEKSLTSFKSSVVEDLHSQNELLTDILNQIQEVSDKVATREVMKAVGDELRLRSLDLSKCLSDLTVLVKEVPDQMSAQTGVLEENLSASLVASLKDSNQKHFDAINDSIFEMENKLHGIKKLVKKGGGGGEDSEDIGLKNVVERVEVVSKRLESVQAAVESCRAAPGEDVGGFDTTLLLTEIRKRAESESLDRVSKDIFTSIHNVQRRLLEEHKRLINRLSEVQSSTPDLSTMQLVEAFNKVRTVQTELLMKQEEGVGAQEETNRLLNCAVDCLEKTRRTVLDYGGGQMASRMADLCEELASTIKSLISIQTTLSQNNSFEKLDQLLKMAAGHLRAENGGVLRRLHRPTGPRRRGDSSSPASEPNSLDYLEVDAQPAGLVPTRGAQSVVPVRAVAKRNRSGESEGRRPARLTEQDYRGHEMGRDEDASEVSDEVLISPGARPKM